MIKHTFVISKWVSAISLRKGVLIFFDIIFPILWILIAGYIFTGGRVILRDFVVQSLIFVLLASSIFGFGIIFIELRRSGVLRLLYTTRVSKHSIIIGAISGRLLISILQFLSILITSEIVYKPHFGFHWISLGVLMLVYGFAFGGISFLLSHIAKNIESYHTVANIVFFPFMFLTGLTFPLYLLPPFLQSIGRLLPPYHMFELAKNIIANNITFAGALISLSTIFVIGIAGYIKGVVDYRWDPNYAPKKRFVFYDFILIALISLLPFLGNIVSSTSKSLLHIFKPSYILKVRAIFDGQNLISGSAVYIGISGERIAFVDKNIPENWKGKKIKDFSSYFALPGLTDGHIHLGSPVIQSYDWMLFNQQRERHDLEVGYLSSGITTVRSLVDDYRDIVEFRRLRNMGLLMSPIILISGPIFTAPDGHPKQIAGFMPENVGRSYIVEVDTPEVVREIVNSIVKKIKPDWIKAVYDGGDNWRGKIPRLKNDVLKALIEESHKNNIKVTVHVGSVKELKTAVELGADMIEHLPLDIIDDNTLQLLKEKNIPICTTTFVRFTFLAPLKQFVNIGFTQERVYSLLRPRLEKYKIESFLDNIPELYRSFAQKRIFRYLNSTKKILRSNLRKLVDNDIQLLSCSDSGNIHTFHGPGLLSELQTLVNFGLTPEEAIQTSTNNVEKILGIKTGKIREGYLANITLYEKNPLEDIRNIYTIKYVVVSGKVIQVSDLLKLDR